MSVVASPYIDAGIVWIGGYGFRPAVWTPPHRADHVDPPRLVPAPDADVAYLGGKYDAPAGHGFGFVLWPDTGPPASPQITAASLAGPTPGPPVWHPSTPSQPWWPSEPNWPDYPCNCITEPPLNPPLPEPAPVALPASASLLIAAVAAFAIIRRRA